MGKLAEVATEDSSQILMGRANNVYKLRASVARQPTEAAPYMVIVNDNFYAA